MLALQVAAVAAPAPSADATSDCPWVGSDAPVEQRVEDVLSRMTLSEKLAIVHGPNIFAYGLGAGNLPGVSRLCLPPLVFVDGPAGIGNYSFFVTQLPAPVALAATWDRDLARRYGGVLGSEARAKGAGVLLGPSIDIVRDPRWGRAFEELGEDPTLTGALAVPEIQGIQDEGVMAQAKHFAVYTQETGRNSPESDAVIDERTLHEIYLPPFEAAVRNAGVASVMCAYSFVNGVASCQHPDLLDRTLKQWMGFDGFVTSDWWAQRSLVPAANAGLDVQMPGFCWFGKPLGDAVADGRIPASRLDDMARRVLRGMFRTGIVDDPPPLSGGIFPLFRPVSTSENAELGRKVAADGIVLLQNRDAVLPLDPETTHSIAVIGPNAAAGTVTAGKGSANVRSWHPVTPLAGIQRRAGSGVIVSYTRSDVDAAAAAARTADVALVFVARRNSGEGRDARTLDLAAGDNALIEAVAAANPRTVVVLATGSSVAMPWLDRVAGVLESWFPGESAGSAIAAVLFGDVNPSGKLPVTFPEDLSQVPAQTPAQWPGGPPVSYSEGTLVGHRWYDANGITPLFPFGFGLSYTSFTFADVVATRAEDGHVDVAVDVTNTGDRAGADVVQAYVTSPPEADEAPRRLGDFTKVSLEPGETRRVHMSIPSGTLARWNSDLHVRAVVGGTYTVEVGDSSAHLPLAAEISVPETSPLGQPLPPAIPVSAQPFREQLSEFLRCPFDAIAPYTVEN